MNRKVLLGFIIALIIIIFFLITIVIIAKKNMLEKERLEENSDVNLSDSFKSQDLEKIDSLDSYFRKRISSFGLFF